MEFPWGVAKLDLEISDQENHWAMDDGDKGEKERERSEGEEDSFLFPLGLPAAREGSGDYTVI